MDKALRSKPGFKECSGANALIDMIAATPAPLALGLVMAFAGAVYLGSYWDNDILYIIALGRSILIDGLPWTDPLTCNDGLNCIAQQWVFCVAAAWIYDNLGKEALCLVIGLLWTGAAATIWAAARTFMPHRPRAAMLATGMPLFLLCMFVKTNPRAFDLACLMLCSIAMERYLSGGRRSWLAAPAACSAFMANMHCTMWVLAAAPAFLALLDGRAHGKRKALIASLAAACAASMLSPYGLAGSTYIFLSLGGGLESLGVSELAPLSLSIGKFGILAATPLAFCVWAALRSRQLNGVRDLRLLDALMCATFILAMLQARNALLLIPVAAIAFAALGNGSNAGSRAYPAIVRIRRYAMMSIIAGAVILLMLAWAAGEPAARQLDGSREAALQSLGEAGVKSGSSVGDLFNTGSWLELNGYKPYVDERAELLLPQVNGGTDLASEFNGILYGTEDDSREWLASHDFDALVIEKSSVYESVADRIYKCADELGYEAVYSDNSLFAMVKG